MLGSNAQYLRDFPGVGGPDGATPAPPVGKPRQSVRGLLAVVVDETLLAHDRAQGIEHLCGQGIGRDDGIGRERGHLFSSKHILVCTGRVLSTFVP